MAGLLTLGLKVISLNLLAFALFASTFYGETGEYIGPRLFSGQQSSCRISLGYLSCFIFGQVPINYIGDSIKNGPKTYNLTCNDKLTFAWV